MHQCTQSPGPSDGMLLSAFANEGSERSFQVLVERYLGMVLGIARRRLGDNGAVDEIAQSVFTILARKAKRLKPETSLGPWIHRVTVIECSEANRRESNHRTRMRAVSSQLLADFEGREVWREALPVLDEAIDDLNKSDREIVMLRFFEHMSFREIGVALGKSEDAAQKQCDRALQRLSGLLGKRGVHVSVAILASGVAALLAPGASLAAASSIARVAVQAASAFEAKLSILKAIEIMTRTKLGTGLLVGVVLGIPLAAQWEENRRLREQLEATARLSEITGSQRAVRLTSSETRVAHAADPFAADSRDSVDSGRNPVDATVADTARHGDAVAAWKQALFLSDPLARSQRLSELMSRLNAEDAPAIAAAFEEARIAGIKFSDEHRLFLRAWGKVGGVAAVEHALQQNGGGSDEAVAALGGWASNAPQQARAWLERMPESASKETLILGLLDGWSTTDFYAAAAYAETRPPSPARDRFRELLLQRAIRARGIDGAKQWVQRIPEDERNLGYKQQAFGDVVQAMLYRDPAAAARWISELGGRGFVGAESVTNTALKLAESSPTGALDWIGSLRSPDVKGVAKGAGTVMGNWAQRDPQAAGAWLQQNTFHPFYERMALGYVRTVVGVDRDGARAWAETIRDEELRGKAMAALEPRIHSQFLVAYGDTARAGNDFAGVAISDGISWINSFAGNAERTISVRPTATREQTISAAAVELLKSSSSTLNLAQKNPHPAGAEWQNCSQCHKQ